MNNSSNSTKIQQFISESAIALLTKDQDPMVKVLARILEQNGCDLNLANQVPDLYDRIDLIKALVKAMLQVRKDTDLRREDPQAREAMAGTNIFDKLYASHEDDFGHPRFVESEFLEAMDSCLEVLSIGFDSASILLGRDGGLGWSSEQLKDGTWLPRRTMAEHLASTQRWVESQKAEKLARAKELERTITRPKTKDELRKELDEIEDSRPKQ